MKCTVDGVEYERVRGSNHSVCNGCVADGDSFSKLELCSKLGDCGMPNTGRDYIWVKVEHE